MKWKTITEKVGEERTIRRFAFLPKKCDDGFTCWWEDYEIHQEFIRENRYPEANRLYWKTLYTNSIETYLFDFEEKMASEAREISKTLESAVNKDKDYEHSQDA